MAGIVAAPAGMLFDRFGGRLVTGAASLLGALGCFVLAAAHGQLADYLTWTLLGAEMAMQQRAAGAVCAVAAVRPRFAAVPPDGNPHRGCRYRSPTHLTP